MIKQKKLTFLRIILLVLTLSCNLSGQNSTPAPIEQITGEGLAEKPPAFSQPGDPDEVGVETMQDNLGDHPPAPAQLIQPEDLEYLGSFRLPEGSNGSNWEYSGYAMTYYPKGDPNGASDGFPGSIFMIGHDHQQMVSEISIPVPVISPGKSLDGLNSAKTLQPFQDISGGMFGYLEIPRAGLAYLPPLGDQTAGKIYFCWGQHMEFEFTPTHGWCEIDLANPQTAGPWSLNGYPNYVTNDYLFEIPASWADSYAPGFRLATGRFRDGTWSGLGPTLFAIAPWLNGNPPPPGANLRHVIPLLLYGIAENGNPEIFTSEDMRMSHFSEADEWSGGAWLTSGNKSAVVFAGTKAIGETWYGFSNGGKYPTSGDPDEAVPEVPSWPHDSRGWWSEEIEAQLIFYNPADLAAVASSSLETWDPQPYAVLSLDQFLFGPGFDYESQKRYSVGAVSFDRERGFLYLVERRADEEKSILHVFQIED